jgi:dolichyl-phosphate beta-glucosyltransferase
MNEDAPVYLSVVIPAFNERDRIGPTIAAIRTYLAAQAYASEIIVVDDGSGDGTADRARQALAGGPDSRVLRLPENRGKGRAVKEGVLAARGRVVLFSDADLSTPIAMLGRLLERLEAGADVVIGSRALMESDVRVHQPRLRESLGKLFNAVVRRLIVPGIRDTQCGFKAFRLEAARELFAELRTEGFCFDVEILDAARRRGLRIEEVPVVWENSKPSGVRVIRGFPQIVRDLARIRRRRKGSCP